MPTEDIYSGPATERLTWTPMSASHPWQPLKISAANQQQKDSKVDTDDSFPDNHWRYLQKNSNRKMVNHQQKDSSMDNDDCFPSLTATKDIYSKLVTERQQHGHWWLLPIPDSHWRYIQWTSNRKTVAWTLMTASHPWQLLKISTVDQQQKDSKVDTDDSFPDNHWRYLQKKQQQKDGKPSTERDSNMGTDDCFPFQTATEDIYSEPATERQ